MSAKAKSRKLRGLAMKAMPFMLTCKELDSFLVDYFDGALTGAVRRRFQWHLWVCPECREYVEGYRATIALGRAVFSVDESDDPAPVPELLIEAILDATKKDP